MSKIKEAKRSILQIMPADGWVAVFSDNDDDGTLPDTTRAQLFAWAVVRELDGKKACTKVTGLFIDDEGQVRRRVGVKDFCGTNVSKSRSGPSHRGNDQGLWEE